MRREAKAIKKLLQVHKTDKVDGTHVKLNDKDDYHDEVMKAWDDITGTELDYKEVIRDWIRSSEEGVDEDSKIGGA